MSRRDACSASAADARAKTDWVRGEYHRLSRREPARLRDDLGEVIEPIVGRPDLDVERVLWCRCGRPERERVDVVEDQARLREVAVEVADHAGEGLGQVDLVSVAAERAMRVAVLIEVEARETDACCGLAELGGEVAQPALVGRVEQPEEVFAKRPGGAVGLVEAGVAPVRPLFVAGRIDGGVAERQRSGGGERAGEPAGSGE
jgi:hypothetical protein